MFPSQAFPPNYYAHRYFGGVVHMSDNTTLNAGTGGDTIANDDIGGVKVQRVKLIHGVDGTNDGDVAGSNPLPVTADRGATGTLANVSATATAGGVTVLASNANRRRAWLYNDSTSSAYVKFGATPSTSSFTKKMLSNEFLEIKGYTGIVTAIWDAANGAMRTTELTV